MSNQLMTDNLQEIDRLSRHELMRFLDLERSKSSTVRLRARARRRAINQSDVQVDINLARAKGT